MTTVLPHEVMSSFAESLVLLELCMEGIISTRGINGAGLKKWIPIIRSDLFNAAPIEAIDNEDVFDAKIQWSETISSSFLKTSCLIVIFSTN